jgi:hypothetical protein
MKNITSFTPVLIEINSIDLSYVETSWTNKTISRPAYGPEMNYFQEIFYYPQINLIILPRYPWGSNAIFLNIATNPYSNYSWCGNNGSVPAYIIFESPFDCPVSLYD